MAGDTNTVNRPSLVVQTGIAATGTNQDTAFPLGPHRAAVEILSVPSGSGVTLPTNKVGSVVTLRNQDPSNALLVYPRRGGTINGGSVNVPISMAALSSATLWCSSLTNWYS